HPSPPPRAFLILGATYMQDIISTLKNALQQAEAGLEVAVGRLTMDGTERGGFKPSEVLALACVREALAMPVTCLHQIQEPAAAEQAAWHAGLDEGRAQAAPAAVAVPAANADWAAFFAWWSEKSGSMKDVHRFEGIKGVAYDAWKAALAATPAAGPVVPKWIDDPHDIEQGQMLNPEWVRQQQPAIMPKGESAAAQLRAMATNYPTGHSWDKLDAKACIRGALEIEALRALLATATGLPAQAVPDGWKLVPVKLTEKMRCAGEVVSSPSGNAQYGIGRNALALAWTALLDAAPTPPKAMDAAPQAQADARENKPLIARQLGEWHEDDGPVAWWAWCGHEWAGEPAWIGTPLSDNWPGYHTHWTPHPEFPADRAAIAAAKGD
ncbi:MAG: hypothetical protein RR100_23815, partial [Comamonas sp.]